MITFKATFENTEPSKPGRVDAVSYCGLSIQCDTYAEFLELLLPHLADWQPPLKSVT